MLFFKSNIYQQSPKNSRNDFLMECFLEEAEEGLQQGRGSGLFSITEYNISNTVCTEVHLNASSPPVGKLLLSCDSEHGLDSPHTSVGTTVIE